VKNKRAGLLRSTLSQIHVDSSCAWARTVARKALDKDDELKEDEETPKPLTNHTKDCVFWKTAGHSCSCGLRARLYEEGRRM